MKEKLQGIGGAIFWLALTALYISGGIHSVKKHHEGSLSWWLPPWGVYRGIEQFWHNDYAGVDWSDKLHSDTKVLFYLIYTGGEKNRDELKFQNDLNQFREQIKNYPKDKIAILKKNAATYIAFLNSMDDDFMNLISGDTIFYKRNFMSYKTKTLLDSIGILSDTADENDFKIGYEQAFGKNDTTIYLPIGSSQVFASTMTSYQTKLQNIYQDIFKDQK